MRYQSKYYQSLLIIFVSERESDQMVQLMFASIFSHQERGSGRGGANQRWQIESLVTRVPRPLRVEVAFTLTSRLTGLARDLIVHSATNHSAKIVI